MVLLSGQELISVVLILHRDLCTAFGKDVLKLKLEARPMIHELLTEGAVRRLTSENPCYMGNERTEETEEPSLVELVSTARFLVLSWEEVHFL